MATVYQATPGAENRRLISEPPPVTGGRAAQIAEYFVRRLDSRRPRGEQERPAWHTAS